MADTGLHQVPPSALAGARAQAHRAVQLPSLAARANLDPAPDDSHSNLGWDPNRRAMVSQPLGNDAGRCFVIVSLSPLSLSVSRASGPEETLDLAGTPVSEAHVWLDSALTNAGLSPVQGLGLPYELPSGVMQVDAFDPASHRAALGVLADWYDLAHRTLAGFADGLSGLSPGPSPVRCWPHHFDIATYVSLEAGDFETARGIGVGLSPGDESYDQPYFYVNPWPHLPADGLPPLPAPGHWHTQGFVGAIATGEEVLSLTDIAAQVPEFVSGAFAIGREKLGF